MASPRSVEIATVFDAPSLSALLHGTSSSLELAYASVQIPMAVAMVRGRARLRQLLASPVAAVPLTVASGIVCSLFGAERLSVV